MSRFGFRRVGVGLLTGLLLVLAACERNGGTEPLPPVARPNILFILTDDQDTASLAVMPNVRALLTEQGTAFRRYYVTEALCCPSRATTLRGQYPHNTEITGNAPPLGGFQKFHALDEESSTVGVWLQAAGYRTALIGKYLNGYPLTVGAKYVPPGWDEWDSPAGGNAYNSYHYQLNEDGRLASYGAAPQDYVTDVLARKAAAFLRSSVTEGRPFFLYLATYAPHSPATPAPRHQGRFAGVQLPRLPDFDEADVSDKPGWVRSQPRLSSAQIQSMQDLYDDRLASLLAVDELVGAITDTLRVLGQLDRTYIFYASDNGFHLGEHRLPAGKNSAYEADIRVPLIVRGPGVPAGRSLDHLVTNADLAPTFADLAGAEIPGFVDGRSLVPLLRSAGPSPSAWRQSLLVEVGGAAAPRGISQGIPALEVEAGDMPRAATAEAEPTASALRTTSYLYVEYSTGERELYDLRTDPFELQNSVAAAPATLLYQLSDRLAELRGCAGASCRSAEDAPIP